MVAGNLSLILRRLEGSPPILSAKELGNRVQTLRQLGWIEQSEPLRSFPCWGCDGSRLLPVRYIRNNVTGVRQAFIACAECGVGDVESVELERWCLNPLAVAHAALRPLLGGSWNPTELVAAQLWRLGKVGMGGRPLEIFFVRGVGASTTAAIAESLRSRPKALLLMPSELGVSRWGGVTDNLVVSLESIATCSGSGIDLDSPLLESRVAAHFADPPAKIVPRRRSTRLADIEALERELVEHLRSARDHAYACQDHRGAAELLPRPTKEELGRRAGVLPASVTRCFRDVAGAKLRLMWNWAADLDLILDYREP